MKTSSRRRRTMPIATRRCRRRSRRPSATACAACRAHGSASGPPPAATRAGGQRRQRGRVCLLELRGAPDARARRPARAPRRVPRRRSRLQPEAAVSELRCGLHGRPSVNPVGRFCGLAPPRDRRRLSTGGRSFSRRPRGPGWNGGPILKIPLTRAHGVPSAVTRPWAKTSGASPSADRPRPRPRRRVAPARGSRSAG